MRIREYEVSDRIAVMKLSTRLIKGVAPWRDPAAVAAAARAWVAGSIEGHDPATRPVFVAEDTEGVVIGFVTVGTREHWSKDADAYVGELVVAEAASRRGVGRALMEAAHTWARRTGHGRCTVETGAANATARAFYAALGYRDEDIRLSMPLTISQQ